MLGRLWFMAVLFSLLFGTAGLGQTTAANSTTITSSTELVLVPAVVTDKSGSHIAGLTKDDFVLKQDGKAQTLAIFEEVKTTSARLHRSSGENQTFSNFDPSDIDHRSSDYHRLSIIVLDFVNTPFLDQSNARKALLKFLSDVADSGEPMCLFELTARGLVLLNGFTDDPKLLATALKNAQSSAAPIIHEQVEDPHHPVDGPDAAALTAMIRKQLQNEAVLASAETKNAAFLTVQALQQLAKAFRGLPGRKSLIWASSGFPFSLSPSVGPSSGWIIDNENAAVPTHTGAEMQAAYDNLWRLMNDAEIAIYSVDLRTATVAIPIESSGVRPSDAGDPQYDMDTMAHERMADTNNTLRRFADNTGGKAFLGGGNLVQSFHQAVQDDTSYYMLGYYVASHSTKPGWHNLSLTVRAKGSQLRYRNGFFLNRDTSTASAQRDIQLATGSPFDFTGVPVSVTWSGTEPGKTADKKKVKFDLVLPPKFALIDESDQNHMVVDIAAVARDGKGDVVADFSQRIDVHLKPESLQQIQQHGMTYRNGLQLPPGTYSVRFVVRDSIANQTGSVAAPVTVAAQ